MSKPAADQLVRPRQVTMAGWLIILGSVAVVLAVFSMIGGLRSLETRESIERMLAEPPVSGLDLTVESAREALRIVAMVAAACATAAAILGWQVLQRSRSARLALAVLAPPLFVSGMLIGIESRSFFPSIVVAAALMLWLQPARDWFDGKAPQPAPKPAPVAPAAATGPLESWPPPTPSTGAAPTGYPLRHVGPAGTAAAGPAGPRPVHLVWACVVTWAMSGLAGGVLLLAALALAVTPANELDRLISENPQIADSGFSSSMVDSVVITALVLAAWSIAAAGLALATWLHRSWAHVPLVASATVAGVFCLGGVLASPLLVLPLGACVATVVLLLRANVRWWLRSDLTKR